MVCDSRLYSILLDLINLKNSNQLMFKLVIVVAKTRVLRFGFEKTSPVTSKIGEGDGYYYYYKQLIYAQQKSTI